MSVGDAYSARDESPYMVNTFSFFAEVLCLHHEYSYTARVPGDSSYLTGRRLGGGVGGGRSLKCLPFMHMDELRFGLTWQ